MDEAYATRLRLFRPLLPIVVRLRFSRKFFEDLQYIVLIQFFGPLLGFHALLLQAWIGPFLQ